MNADPNDFDALRKLLALKRHEQPPPGYFDRLPGQIMARLKEEPQPSFWERFFPNITFKPAYAYAFGFVVCGSLVFGIGYSLQTPDQVANAPAADGSLKLAGPSPNLTKPLEPTLTLKPVQATAVARTNGNQEPKSLFDGLQLQQQQVQPASFQQN